MSVDFSQSCLLIIDFQNFFTDKKSNGFVSQSEEIKLLLRKLTSFFIKQKKLVVATRHFNNENKKDPFFTFYGKVIKKESSLFQLSKPFSNMEGIAVVDKSTYSPFFNRDFLRLLKSNKISNIFVSGLLLEKCVLATSFDAFQNGYNVFVIKECVASRKREHEKILFDLIEKSCGKVISFREFF